jgi:mRNA deadenylase 3'-5' endonuclease subunit Ccr4
MKSKIYRCNCRKIWSIQNRKSNLVARSILLNGAWSTEIKPERNCNPKGFVTTKRSQEILINPVSEIVEGFEKKQKLIFDKVNIHFNLNHGEFLYFAEDGTCYLLVKKER